MENKSLWNDQNNETDYKFFEDEKRLSAWLTSLGKDYEKFDKLFEKREIVAKDLFLNSAREDVFEKFSFAEPQRRAVTRAVECIKELLSKNPLCWNSHETAEFLYTLGSEYWNSVWVLKKNEFTASRIMFFKPDDAEAFERIVGNISHRNSIVWAIEWICNPINWSKQSLSNWVASLGSDYIPLSQKLLNLSWNGQKLLSGPEKSIKTILTDEKKLLRLDLELKRLGALPVWSLEKNNNDKPIINTFIKPLRLPKSVENSNNKSPQFSPFKTSASNLINEISACNSYAELYKAVSKWEKILNPAPTHAAAPFSAPLSPFQLQPPFLTNSFQNNNLMAPKAWAPYFNQGPTAAAGAKSYAFQIASPSSVLPQTAALPFIERETLLNWAYSNSGAGTPFKSNGAGNVINKFDNGPIKSLAKTPPIVLGEGGGKMELIDEIADGMDCDVSLMSVLVVGETDFGFSACFCECLQKKIKNISLEGLKLSVCSVKQKDEITEEQRQNISSLECHEDNVETFYGVDFANWDYCGGESINHVIWPLLLIDEKKIDIKSIEICFEKFKKNLTENGKIWLIVSDKQKTDHFIPTFGKAQGLLFLTSNQFDKKNQFASVLGCFPEKKSAENKKECFVYVFAKNEGN